MSSQYATSAPIAATTSPIPIVINAVRNAFAATVAAVMPVALASIATVSAVVAVVFVTVAVVFAFFAAVFAVSATVSAFFSNPTRRRILWYIL